MTEAVNATANILIVDDEPSIVRLLTRALHSVGYTSVVGFTAPIEALNYLNSNAADLVVLDVNMPGMSGYDFLDDLSRRLTEDTYLPVLMVSGLPEAEARLPALQAGANNFLTKPIDIRIFLAHVRSLLETRFRNLRLNKDRGVLEELVRRRTGQLQQADLDILARLAKVAEYRDDATGEHAERVGQLCGLLAQEMGFSQEKVTLIIHTAPLHDVGKVGIPDAVLLKPGIFNDEEREIMRKHSWRGADLLKGSSELLRMAEGIALYHHERWDGMGYPCGLSSDEIPLTARIVSVVDTFDALIHARPYKKAWAVSDALAEIERERGCQFDPDVVDALFRLYSEGRLYVPEGQVPATL